VVFAIKHFILFLPHTLISMKKHIKSLLLVLLMMVHVSDTEASNEEKDKNRPVLKNYNITEAEYESLPRKIRNRMPAVITDNDSVIIAIALMGDDRSNDYPKHYNVNGNEGTIELVKDDLFVIKNAEGKDIGLIQKNKTRTKRNIINPGGSIVFSDWGMNGLLWAGAGLIGLFLIYGLYILMYVIIFSVDTD